MALCASKFLLHFVLQHYVIYRIFLHRYFFFFLSLNSIMFASSIHFYISSFYNSSAIEIDLFLFILYDRTSLPTNVLDATNPQNLPRYAFNRCNCQLNCKILGNKDSLNRNLVWSMFQLNFTITKVGIFFSKIFMEKSCIIDFENQIEFTTNWLSLFLPKL